MAYTLALDVNIGDYTKASNHDNLSTNVDYLQVLADVQHNFNIITGTGYHKAITQLITDAAGATVKDLLTSEWDPASGSATIGQAIRLILAKMPDSANNQDIYAALRTISDTVTSTSEEGRVVLALMAAGTLTDQIEILKNAVRPTTDSLLNLGSASQRLLGVFTDTLGDSGQQLAIASSSVRVALQPSFLAIVSGGYADVTGDNTSYTLILGTEVFDQGGNFDGTSTFTAPVTGRYLLSGGVGLNQIGAGHTQVSVSIVTSNRTYTIAQNKASATATAGTDLALSGAMLVDMDAADTAVLKVVVFSSTKTVDILADVDKTYFSGCMVH